MKITNNKALIYGILLGDGCLSRTSRASFISITCGLKEDKPLFELILPILKNLRGKEVRYYERPKYGKIEIVFSDKRMFRMYQKIGFPVGKKGPNIRVSSLLLPFMKEVILGYFATDGSLVLTNNNGTLYPRIEFASISKELLKQVKDYLDSIGIQGKVYIGKDYGNQWNTKFRYQSNGRSNLTKFRKMIGFIHPKHEEKFQKYKIGSGGGGI